MPSRPSLLSGLFGLRCPRCRRGDLFPTGSFSFKQPFEQYEHCPKCAKDYFPEPGFYWGAMFLSYIGSGFFCLGFVMLLHWVFDLSLATSFVALITVGALLFVWWFRFSRALYFYMVTPYQKEFTEGVDAGTITAPTPKTTSSH